ncbi:hypothetical protein PHLCEN_2v9746 [Hermanssonia centrifuga]|uniref:Uncharacterized protein n=1 Tax=Hermanssonia centrifuga TaxID=98765 RepID=A0A2R6NPY1_9APHY|nr:hypothetical protein PHLCEN_2v9746 [Hermanssonia centrifuga]
MEQYLEMQEAGIEASIVYSPTPNYPGANPVSHGPPMVRIERASPIQSAPSSPALPFDHSLLTPFDYEQKDFAQRPSSAPPATVSFEIQAPAEASSFCQNNAFSELLPPPPPLWLDLTHPVADLSALCVESRVGVVYLPPDAGL